MKLEEKDRECKDKIRVMELGLDKKEGFLKSQKDSKFRKEIEQLRAESEEHKKRLIQVKEEEKKLIEKFHQEEIHKLHERFNKEKDYVEDERSHLVEKIQELEKQNLMNRTVEIQLSE